MLKAADVSAGYGGRRAIRGIDLRVAPGEWWMLAGPNGAGKSTLLRALAGALPYEGGIALLGRELRDYRPLELARLVGMLAQRHAVGYAFSVEEVVRLGRYAYARGLFHRGDPEGDARVEEALAQTGLSALRARSVLSLSGGELQRVFLAQALAQQPRLLLLDEPANHLDPPYQKELFELIGDWLRVPGRAVVTVMHDVSLARRYGTHALLLRAGEIVAAGETGAALSRQHLQAVYGMDVQGWFLETLSAWE